MGKIISVTKKFFESLIWKDVAAPTSKRDLNTGKLWIVGISLVAGGITIILFLPATPPVTGDFQEKRELGLRQNSESPTADINSQTQTAFGTVQGQTIPYYNGGGGTGGSGTSSDRNTTMILVREGLDSTSQLPAGSKFQVRLLDKMTVSDEAVPLIGVVTKGVSTETAIAIPEGTKIFGLVSYQKSSGRAMIRFQSVAYPNGAMKELMGIAQGSDGQIGVEGRVKSKAFMNTAGQMITRFVGSYAEGTVSRDFMGHSQGGAQNGLLSAVADTAKDRTQKYGEDMKAEKEWIEIEAGTEVLVMVTAPFRFREPGVVR